MSGREGVRLYKALHRTVQRVFRGDRAAMFAARDKVTPGIFCNLLQLVTLQHERPNENSVDPII